jgi:ribose transport system permease protein
MTKAGPEGQRSTRGGHAPTRLLDGFERYALVGAWALVIVVFGVLRPDTFLTGATFGTMLGSQAVIAVLTLGLIIPLTAGDYDLSVAGNLTLSAMLVAVLNVNHDWPVGLAVLAALAAGVLVGLINGGLILLFGIESLIVTLGTGTFLQGIVLWLSNSTTITGISPALVDRVIVDRLFGISLEFYYALGICLFIWYVFEFTPLGRRLLIVGRNRSVARLSGLRVRRIRWGALMASGFVSALAGVIYAGTSGGADPTSGNALLLPAFAAAFLGSTAITPGRFNPLGAFIAVYFLVTGITGLEIVGVESFVQYLFYGGALVIAVVLSQLARRRQPLDTGVGG